MIILIVRKNMRLLFTLDTKDYNRNGSRFIRPSSRAIIIKDKKIAMIHSLKYDYYKFLGGGIEPGEDKITALIREVEEEAGLIVKLESVKEYGYVHRIQKGHVEDVLIQDNYYYFCDVEKETMLQKLDDYEADEQFTLEFVDPCMAIKTNRKDIQRPKDPIMIEREARVLEYLIKEKYF